MINEDELKQFATFAFGLVIGYFIVLLGCDIVLTYFEFRYLTHKICEAINEKGKDNVRPGE